MSREQERSQLKELIYNAMKLSPSWEPLDFPTILADYLLENGVIVSPVKIGDTVWFTPMYEGKPLGMVREDKVQVIGASSRGFHLKLRNHQDHNKTYYLGKTVFLTQEEAEKALKKST